MTTKRLRLQRCGGGGYNYFENLPDGGGYNYFDNLPDELVILIFTKLSSSSSSSKDEDFLDDNLGDIISLGRSSAVCKRFDALTCLVPTLSLRHRHIDTLYECCPKILKKFKHIRSLQVTHSSYTETLKRRQHKPLPFISWEAAYRPRSYRLSFVSSQKFSHYIDDPQSLMDAAKDDAFLDLTRLHNFNMIYLHHMLVSSIKDHVYLQRVVVSDFNDRGTLTLEDDMLVELRNSTSPIYEEEVWARNRSGSVINLDVITSLKPPRSGVVMNNFYFSIIEWSAREKDTEYFEEDDDESGLPRGMLLKCHRGVNLSKVLTSVMEDADDDVEENDDKLTFKILSHIESEGYLL